MISAWQVYLFMQIENVSVCFLLASVVFGISSTFHALKIDTDNYGKEKDFKPAKKKARIACLLFFIAALIPSQKTIAAMYLLPKLTSKEVTEPLTAEAQEIYSLLKEVLKKMTEAE